MLCFIHNSIAKKWGVSRGDFIKISVDDSSTNDLLKVRLSKGKKTEGYKLSSHTSHTPNHVNLRVRWPSFITMPTLPEVREGIYEINGDDLFITAIKKGIQDPEKE